MNNMVAKGGRKSAAMGESSLYFSKSFEKGLKIISLFHPERRSLSLTEVSEMTGEYKTGVYRYLNTLVKLEYLTKDPRTKLLTLASKSLLLGLNLSRGFSLLQAVKPLIDEVYEKQHITIDSAILCEGNLVKLYRREAVDALTYPMAVIDPALHSIALGKAIMASLPFEEARKMVDNLDLTKKTENTLTTRKRLLADLRETQERGYAVNNEEHVIGLVALAAPFMNKETKRPVGAVSFDFSTAQHSLKEVQEKYAGVLKQLADGISGMV